MPVQDEYKELMLVLIAGIFLFLVLVGIVVFTLLFHQKKNLLHNQELLKLQAEKHRELLKTQLETQEATFEEVSRELHDNVGQLLSSTKILLVMTERSLPEVPSSLSTATETLAKALEDIRSLSRSLNSEWLLQFNFGENLRNELDRVRVASGLELETELNISEKELDASSKIMLFRVVQEALQNCIRHSEASALLFKAVDEDGKLAITISDNGKGFEYDPHGANGLGLRNMVHRIALLNGKMDITTAPGSGTFITIAVPYVACPEQTP